MSMFVWQQSNYRSQLCRYALLQEVLPVACMAGKFHLELADCDGRSGAHSWPMYRQSNSSNCRFLTKCHEGIIKELLKITCSFVRYQKGAILIPILLLRLLFPSFYPYSSNISHSLLFLVHPHTQFPLLFSHLSFVNIFSQLSFLPPKFSVPVFRLFSLFLSTLPFSRHTVAQLVTALCYQLEGQNFNSR